MLNRWMTPLAVALTALGLPAQDDALQQKRTDKLAEAWVENAPWTTDYDAALASAKETGKLVFGYFTRSYAP